MRLNGLRECATVSVMIVLMPICVLGQGSMHRPAPESSTQDSSGNLKTGEEHSSRNIRGVVKLPDGNAPEELVEIIAACPASHRLVAVADSKGKFSFVLDQQRESDKDWSKGCTLYAFLEGYRSGQVSFADAKIVLQPITSDQTGLTSLSDTGASDSQEKGYHRAIDRASKQDWKGASVILQEVISSYPRYSSALLTLGICLQNLGHLPDAEKAYLDAAHADPKFALPLIRAAALESAAGNMQAAAVQSEKAIKLNPKAFPDAYSLNAIAEVSTQDTAAAEKSARAGLALDTGHQYPELEYALGMILSTNDDPAEGRAHLQKYIEQSPGGPNVSAARNELAQLTKPTAADERTAPAGLQAQGPTVAGGTSELLPGTTELQDVNGPLLTNSGAYTCLESVLPAKFDPHGRPAVLDTIRVDIAVSGGKEIYGVADGKHFSNSAQREMLGYSFSTSGLFSSIARSLIAANQFDITPAGETVFKGQTLLRYNFHSLPTTAGWTISYGKESGVAKEQGWFLIDSKSRVLRRVFVAATDIPANLKLIGLSALVDYESETLAGHRALLPGAARIEGRERSGIKRVGLLSFDHCRAFTADSAMSFDDPNSAAQMEKQINPAPLPQNLQILVSLTSALSAASALQSDVITATVAKPVMEKGHELIQAGAAIEGHVRLEPGEAALSIQLDRVQTSSGWVPFYAQLIKVGSSLVQIQNLGVSGQMPPALLASDNNADLTEPDIPGVATIAFVTNDRALPIGTQMLWKTQPLLTEHKESPVPNLNTSMGLH